MSVFAKKTNLLVSHAEYRFTVAILSMKPVKKATKLTIPGHSLDYWRKVGLLSSKPKADLDFTDLIKARFIALCRKQGISLQLIRQIAQQNPSWQRQLTVYGGNRLVAKEGDVLLDVEDRQMLLCFDSQDKTKRIELSRQKNKYERQKQCSRLHSDYQRALDNGNVKEMEKILRKMTEIEPGHVEAWVELGNLLFSLKKDRLAYLAYKSALQYDPLCQEALYNLGNLHFKAKRYAAAIRCFRSCLQINPEFAEVYYNFGLLLYQIGYHQAAITMLEGYLRLDPSSFWSDQARQFIENSRLELCNEGQGQGPKNIPKL